MSFRGRFPHNMDSKGRVVLPAKFREGLGESFVITKGLDDCLFAFTAQAFAELEEKVKNLPLADEGVRKFVRFFFGEACDCESDAQGRVVIPQYLREYAGIEKEVISIGLPGRVELWSKEKREDNGKFDKEIEKRMAELGI